MRVRRRIVQKVRPLLQRLRARWAYALIGGVAGLAAAGVILAVWPLPLTCRDLSFPDPPQCFWLGTMRAWTTPFRAAVGVVLGWRHGGRRLKRSAGSNRVRPQEHGIPAPRQALARWPVEGLSPT